MSDDAAKVAQPGDPDGDLSTQRDRAKRSRAPKALNEEKTVEAIEEVGRGEREQQGEPETVYGAVPVQYTSEDKDNEFGAQPAQYGGSSDKGKDAK